MNKARIVRIARLVALRQQQRRIREAEHAHAQALLDQASKARDAQRSDCEDLDRFHDETLCQELDPVDLDLIGSARNRAREQLAEAESHVEEATEEADARQVVLLEAYRSHRSLEMFHEKVRDAHHRDVARAEQKELDDLAQRATGTRRPW